LANVGVIGLGQMGILHAAISNSIEGHTVVAISDNDSFLLKLASKVLPAVNFYSDYHEMLQEEHIDALYVCTPVHSHYPIAHDVLTNYPKIGLFVEKPLSGSYEEARRMVGDSQNRSSITMVGYQKRFAGVFKKVKEILEANILRDVSFFRSHFFGATVMSERQGWKFQRGTGGATLEYGVHLLDLLIWYFGEPVSVQSTTKSIFSPNVEDFVCANTEFPSGIKGSVEISWSMRNFSIPELLIEVHGTNGYMSVTEDRILLFLNQADRESGLSEGMHFFFRSALDQQVPFLVAYPENVLQDMTFLNCVNSGTQPEQNFECAAKVNRFVDLILSKW
jgi:predicted dehydrogenase